MQSLQQAVPLFAHRHLVAIVDINHITGVPAIEATSICITTDFTAAVGIQCQRQTNKICANIHVHIQQKHVIVDTACYQPSGECLLQQQGATRAVWAINQFDSPIIAGLSHLSMVTGVLV